VAAGRLATEHLLSLGHRRIAFLTHERYVFGRSRAPAHPAPSDENHSGQPDQDRGMRRAILHFDAWEQFCGYEAVMYAAGLEPLVVTHPISAEINVEQQFVDGGVRALDALLAHPGQPTAVVCYNDLEAFGLIRGARLKGLQIPERLSIVGFGDLQHSQIIAPALTTIRVPALEVGQQAALALLECVGGRAAESARIEATIVVRESTAAFSPEPSATGKD
jgi:DNA-binding LacI/PurR family transcriptional regulator